MFCIDNLKNGKFHQHLRDIFAPQVRKIKQKIAELGTVANCGVNAPTVATTRHNRGDNLPQFSIQNSVACRP